MDFTQTLKKHISKVRKHGSVVYGYIGKHLLNNNLQFFSKLKFKKFEEDPKYSKFFLIFFLLQPVF
jgi:hypothetical protein